MYWSSIEERPSRSRVWGVRFKTAVAILVIGAGTAGCSVSLPISSSTTSRPVRTTTTTGPVIPTNDSAQLTISSPDLTVGQLVTVSGTDCPPNHWGTAVLDQTHSGDYPAIFQTTEGLYDNEAMFGISGGQFGGTVGADGRWTMTTTVPMVAPGPARLSGWCSPNQGAGSGHPGVLTEFLYPFVPVTVATPYLLEIDPGTAVSSGTTLTVKSVGGGCPIPSDSRVNLYTDSLPQTQVASGATQDAVPSDQAQAGWQATLTVPTGLNPGRYQLEADCVYSRGAVLGSYAPTIISVQ
jgi:hypothetical protein